MEDRRIKRTKRFLSMALVELLAEKPVNEITVKELTERSDVNRATFYRHYRDIYDMLRQMEQELFGEFTAALGQEPPPENEAALERLYCRILRFVADRAELCIRIGECEQELQELLANPAALPDLTDCKINHKMFGAGTVRPAEGQFMVIDFNGTLKKFSYTASMNSGYLSAEDPNVEARLQAYQDYNKDKERLEKELKNLKAELVKL